MTANFKTVFCSVEKKLNKLEAQWILCEILALSKGQLYLNFNQQIASDKVSQINQVVKRRLSGEPLQYILGKTNFYGLDIFVGEGVFIPRPETEVLVEKSLQLISNSDKVLDLCTGSASIPLALLSQQPKLDIIASDISKDALRYAKKNNDYHQANLALVESNLFQNIASQKFKLITVNPPYIASNLYQKLPREVKGYEPELALHSGKKGLDLIKKILVQAKYYLQEDGYLFLEVCSTHIEKTKMIANQSYSKVEIFEDYTGRRRFLLTRSF